MAGSIAVNISEGDIFAVPKATAVILCAVIALAVAGVHAVLTGRIALPRGAAVWSVVALWVAMVLSTITSTQPGQSLVGQYSQDAGLLQYTAYVALFLVVLRTFRPEQLRLLVRAIVAAAAFVSLYAVYQWLGHDPVDWNRPGQVFSVMGNVDFLGGWCGCVAPTALMVAAWRNEWIGWRILGGVTAAATAFASYATHSFQGPMSVAAGVGLLVVLLGFDRARTVAARLPRIAIISVGVGFLLVAAVAVPRVQSAVRGGIENGLIDRRHFWHAAIETGADHPILGTGLDTFHNQFEPRRPIGQARYRGENAGAAHSVPLDMWANGGILVFGAYLAFIGFTGWRLAVGLRQQSGDRRLLLAGLGASWVGYQVQGAVSIDKPALAVLHFVLAGAVHVLAGVPEWREWRFMGSPQRGPRSVSQTDLSGVQVTLATAVLLLGALGAWFGSRPFRADLVYASGVRASATDPTSAVKSIRKALALNPTEARYTYDLSRAYLALGDNAAAVAAASKGFRLEPGDSSYAMFAASVAANVGDLTQAGRLYDRGVAIDPRGLDVLLNAAIFEAKVGHADKARQLVARAYAINAERSDTLTRALEVFTVLGDEAGVADVRRRMGTPEG